MDEHSIDPSVMDIYEDLSEDSWSGFWSNKELGRTKREVKTVEVVNG